MLLASVQGYAADAPSSWGDWRTWGDQKDGTYRNPVLPSDYSDLDCIRVGSDYYAISSTFQYSPGMVILHSKDLVNWQILGHVVDDVTQIGPEMNWDRMNRYGRGIWAGAIRHHAGKFWVYFGTPEEGYFMSTAENPAGPWTPLHRVMGEAGWDDCCPFWDDDGQGYFIGTHFKNNYKTWLYKLTPDGRDLVKDSRVLLNEGSGREANKLYKINGTYYHFYSEHRKGVGRCVMMQRAPNIAGPYTEKRQLSHGQSAEHEPNQGGIVQTEKGDWYFLTHHGKGDWEGRPASLLPVTWKDGWPILGKADNDDIGTMVWSAPKPLPGSPIVTPQTDDAFDGPKLGVQWEWNYQPRADKWSLTERPGALRLHAFKPLHPDDLKAAGNTLTQRSFRTTGNLVTLALDLSGMADGQVAGLCHFSRDYSTIAVRCQNGNLTLESARNKSITQGTALTSRKIWLRSEWGLDGKSRYSYSTDGTVFTAFGETCQLGWADYRGDRIGIFNYNNNAEAGYVDCDAFTYRFESSANPAGSLPVAAPAQPAADLNGVMLGTWNTLVEFDDVKITSGTKVILDDSFTAGLARWQQAGGDWQVFDNVCRQSSNSTPAVARYAFHNQGPDYTITVRAKKLSGTEGFLIGFGSRDSKNFYWLNLGGWNNTTHRLEKTEDGERIPIGPAVQGNIETGRWYEIKIQVEGRSIQCFLDGQRIFNLTDNGFGILPADNDKSNFGQALIPDMAADPSIVEIDGTFYCYATTDGWGKGLETSGTPVVWQSTDFLNWSFEGSSFPPDFDLKYWAPSSLVRKNGRYYSFPTLDGKVTAVIAESPTGPFLAPDGKHVTKANHQPYPVEQKHTIDAEVFVDDDGQSYMIWATRRIVKLKPDLLSADSPTINMPTKRGGYSEGPFFFKRKGIYYHLYTLGGDETYQYAYMMSRTSPLGPWESPEQDIIATTDRVEKVMGPGHGCFFHPQDSEQWYFIYLEYGRGGTTRQIYADRMNFNADGTIQPIKLTKAGVGALRPIADPSPNLAAGCSATASSSHPNYRVRPRKDPSLDRVETYSPANALDASNGTRWLAADADTKAWWQVDLGEPRDIRRTEAYFVKPAAGHSYRLEWSLDGRTWQPYGGHDDVIRRSPHRDVKTTHARYLKLTILQGEPGLWEFRVY
ncbi:MAG TPA: family 43 glycosylhydrolase [Candidatus Methylacidiphilales bacterium]|nr:family 43 glycosylhydrolase [Candidatus Methylacidiphilales bacterium]